MEGGGGKKGTSGAQFEGVRCGALLAGPRLQSREEGGWCFPGIRALLGALRGREGIFSLPVATGFFHLLPMNFDWAVPVPLLGLKPRVSWLKGLVPLLGVTPTPCLEGI